jgi:Mg-chelatase subunit ChlD
MSNTQLVVPAAAVARSSALSLLSQKTGGKPITVALSPGTFNHQVFLLIDCSGSMAGGKLNQAIAGALDFAESARRSGYKIGLISFASQAQVLCPATEDLPQLKNALSGLIAGGGTDLAAALELGGQVISDGKNHRALCIVSDGFPNPDSQPRILALAAAIKAKGVDLMVLGTDDADRAFLQRLASSQALATTVTPQQLRTGISQMASQLRLSQLPDL